MKLDSIVDSYESGSNLPSEVYVLETSGPLMSYKKAANQIAPEVEIYDTLGKRKYGSGLWTIFQATLLHRLYRKLIYEEK